MKAPPQCPRTGAPLGELSSGGPLRCVRCQRMVVEGEGPPGHYWCSSSGGSTEDSLDLGATVYTTGVDAEEAPESTHDLPGYHLAEILGRGGAGVVYRARREADGRVCALKLLAAGSWSSAKQRVRFQREIDALRRFRDPGVVEIIDAGEAADGGPWYAMALIDGPTLHEVLAERGALPPDEAARVARRLAETLARLHGRGLFHRDVKPGNVLMTRDGQPLLSDFGLVLDAAVTERLTRTHQMLGTPRYMAPEQLMGSVDDWARADIYALGVVLYECLGGQVRRSLSGVHTVEPVDGAPADLLWIARRASAFEPTQRYAQVSELAADLARWQAGRPVRRRPQALAWEGRRWINRNRVAVGVVLALLIALGGSRAWRAWQEAQGEREAWAEWRLASADIDAARAAEDEAAAAARFGAFIAEPARQGRAALGAAWLDEARWRRSKERWEESRAAFGEAWLGTEDAEVRAQVLLGLAELYSATGAYRPLGELLDLAPTLAPDLEIPGAARLRAEVALARRDIATAERLLSSAEAPLVGALAQVLQPELRWALPLDLDGDGVDELIERDDVRGQEGARAPPSDAACAACWRMQGEVERPMVWQSYDVYERRPEGWVPLTPSNPAGVYKAVRLAGRVFYATGVTERGLWEARAGQRVPAHPPTDALDSYIESLSAGDLDGDGVPELVACTGAPFGYVVRVFALAEPGRGDAGGSLTLRAELPLGRTVANVVDTPEGPRLAVLVSPERPSVAVTSDAEHAAQRARLVLLRWVGDGFEETASLRFSLLFWPEALRVADVDGDGLDDLVGDGRWVQPEDFGSWELASVIWRMGADGSPAPPLRLWGVGYEGPVEVDGDPALEHLWSSGPERGGSFITGAGEDSRRPARSPAGRPREEGDVLGALGLNEAAARTWERKAALEADRAQAAWRAAERWWAAAGRQREAASAAKKAAFAGAAPSPVDLSRAVEHAIEAMDFVDALAMAEQLAALRPDAEPERLAWLRGFAEPSMALDLKKPLGAAWTVHVPKAVRHDMLEGTLTLTPVSGQRQLLELALRATGGPVWMELTLDWLRAEWGNELYLRLRERGVEGLVDNLIRFGSGLSGGVQGRDMNSLCTPSWRVQSAQREDHLSVRVADRREGDARSARCLVDGRVLTGEERRELSLEAGDRVVFSAESLHRWPVGQLGEYRLTGLRLGGLVVDEAAPKAPLRPWVAWSRGLGPLPDEAPGPELVALLRQDPMLGPQVQAALGPEVYAQVFAEAWDDAAGVHHADSRVQEAMRDLPPLDSVAPDIQAVLRVAQGEARWRAGDVEGARASLLQAIALAEPDLGWHSAWEAEALLAELALALGDEAAARRHVEAAAAWAPNEALGWRMLRQRERLADVVEVMAPK